MPAVALEVPRQGRSVLKLSLGITTAVIVCLLGAIFFVGTPAYSATAYTLTGLCGNCNWSDPTKWSPNTGSYPGQAVGDSASICVSGATLTVDVNVPNGVILNMNCAGGTLNIPGAPATNSLQLEASSLIGSGGAFVTVNGGKLTLNGAITNSAASITLNSGTASNLSTYASALSMTIAGGTLNNSGTINLNPSTFTFNGGTLSGA